MPTPARHFSHLRLRTPRLTLRPLQAGDEADLFAIFGDPQVMRWWSTPAWPSMAPAQALVESDALALASGESLRLGLVARDGGPVLGTCSLFAFHEDSRRAEIGYALARAAWGRGLMHEALSALVAHAFGPLGLHRLEADIDPRNAASARALARLGFREEGRLRERWIVGGEVSDSAIWGRLASDPAP